MLDEWGCGDCKTSIYANCEVFRMKASLPVIIVFKKHQQEIALLTLFP